MGQFLYYERLDTTTATYTSASIGVYTSGRFSSSSLLVGTGGHLILFSIPPQGRRRRKLFIVSHIKSAVLVIFTIYLERELWGARRSTSPVHKWLRLALSLRLLRSWHTLTHKGLGNWRTGSSERHRDGNCMAFLHIRCWTVLPGRRTGGWKGSFGQSALIAMTRGWILRDGSDKVYCGY